MYISIMYNGEEMEIVSVSSSRRCYIPKIVHAGIIYDNF